MAKLRVLVAEDSLTVRRRLIEILRADPHMDVVGEAADGKQAVDLAVAMRPDVITMDMMLPVMTGLAATEYIMAHCPTPILIVSASTNRGELFHTYDALACGAVDVLDKPTGLEPAGAWETKFLAAVKLVSKIKVVTRARSRLMRTSSPLDLPASREITQRYAVAAVGASTGGPGAVVEVLRGLPHDFRLPILLVLHINEPFGAAFADWLDAQTTRRVAHARDGQVLEDAAGRVVMAPGDSHLILRDGRLRLTKDSERHSCRPSIDVLFESLAAESGAHTAAVLLTGMGRDGAKGLLEIRKAGGLTIAQDEATSVIYGMPREAAAMGAAGHILPLGQIASTLGRLSKAGPELRS